MTLPASLEGAALPLRAERLHLLLEERVEVEAAKAVAEEENARRLATAAAAPRHASPLVEGACTPLAERPSERAKGAATGGGGARAGAAAWRREGCDPMRHLERAHGGASGSGDHLPPAGAGAPPPPPRVGSHRRGSVCVDPSERHVGQWSQQRPVRRRAGRTPRPCKLGVCQQRRQRLPAGSSSGTASRHAVPVRRAAGVGRVRTPGG